MGKATILTTVQRKFLELVLKEQYLLKRYYWTGGTVLSEFYLHHRDSYDIDLFTGNEEIHLPSVSKFVSLVGRSLGAVKTSYARFLGLHSFQLSFPRGESLKVDFNYYPFPRINVGKKWNGLAIDSLQDIAVNKVHTIAMRPRERDYIDLYFILQNHENSLIAVKEMIGLAKAKFDWHIEPHQLGENFSKVVTVKDIPKMLVPFDRKKMIDFFLDLAKSLKKDIFR